MIKILLIICTLALILKLNHWSEEQKLRTASHFIHSDSFNNDQKSFFDPDGFSKK